TRICFECVPGKINSPFLTGALAGSIQPISCVSSPRITSASVLTPEITRQSWPNWLFALIDAVLNPDPSTGNGTSAYGTSINPTDDEAIPERSEERRVGKECRSRWS